MSSLTEKKQKVASFITDTDNEMFQLAVRLVNQSNRDIFLTGKAGTGKTTFLKYIRENCLKQLAVLAPTGVAAINAGGVTIHSFFQLPLSPFIPETRNTGFQAPGQEIANKHSLISRLRFNSEKKKVLQQLELLVIDEISMVRCDTLDAIDTILRHVRQRPDQRFGGVQMLFIGDMLQLPPVIKEQEWSLLREYYEGQYFFDSWVLRERPPVYIEFNKIYRQRDGQFIELLNQVRNNQINELGLALLGQRFDPSFTSTRHDGYIVLTTHNTRAAEINIRELNNINSPLFSYKADVEDDFSDRAFPAEEVLQLKVGAQVMFIRNDGSEKGKRYFNGRIGVISKLESDKIFVQCAGDTAPIEVSKEKWENIRYTLNKTSRQLDSDVLGSFTQYPLRLAWAITIHKSQGLTFEKAVIDAGAAFAPGQVYVALSRCTSLEGIILQSRVNAASMISDPRIVEFGQRSISANELEVEFKKAKKEFQHAFVSSTFDFVSPLINSKELAAYLLEHSDSFNAQAAVWVEDLLVRIGNLQDISKKFQSQLNSLFEQAISLEDNIQLQDRIKAAAQYFIPLLDGLTTYLQQSPAVTDSRIHSKEYNEGIRDIFAQLAVKRHLINGFSGSFDIEELLKRKQQFTLPSFSINAYAGVSGRQVEGPNKELHQRLRKLRDVICSRKDLPIYLVASSETIDEMARYLPQTPADLKKIKGFGEAKVKSYGDQFLEIILEYCEAYSLSSLMHEKTPKAGKSPKVVPAKKKKADTYEETYKLYKEGKSIISIAEERNLAISTIEGHLCRYIKSGDISPTELIPADKLDAITNALKDIVKGPITPIKERLGDDFSFGEIRFVMASLGLPKEKVEE